MTISPVTSAVSYGNNIAFGRKKQKPLKSYQKSSSYSEQLSYKEKADIRTEIEKDKRNCAIGGFAAGLALLASVNLTPVVYRHFTQPPLVTTIEFNADNDTLEEIANRFDVDVNAIKSYNDLNEENADLSAVKEIKVPSNYDYIDEEIEEKTKELYDAPEDGEKLAELDALKNKKEAQEALAYEYTDGKYVYYQLKDVDENPELKDKYGSYCITAEDFKKLFDIEDGALKDNNELSYGWGTSPTDGRGYRDYSDATLRYGRKVKVPVSSVEDDNIDLSDYGINR